MNYFKKYWYWVYVCLAVIVMFWIVNSDVKTMTDNFDEAFNFVVKNEGGYADDDDDKGGETFMGISKATYPSLDIKKLTIDQVKEIYKKDFWNASFIPAIGHRELSIYLFDWMVLCGEGQLSVIFQRAINATGNSIFIDGEVGKQTLSAYKKINNHEGFLWVLRAEMISYFYDICKNDPTQKKFLKGWIARVFKKI